MHVCDHAERLSGMAQDLATIEFGSIWARLRMVLSGMWRELFFALFSQTDSDSDSFFYFSPILWKGLATHTYTFTCAYI